MFYPATSHVSRTYGAPTTGRRKLAVHNENDMGHVGGAGGLPSKTPSRAGPSGKSAQLVPATAARVGLGAKTEGRDRNVLVRQEGGNGKGKGKDEDIEPKRLFASSSTLPPSKSLSNLPLIPSNRPAQPTKTPARPPPSSRKLPVNNLRTPGPGTFRVPLDVSSTPLPSATRRRRSRSSQSLSGSGGGGTPARPTGGDEFKTPVPSGKWEEGDSLGSIDELVAEGGIELDVLGEVEEESDPEIEYMPPKVKELPYAPDWELDVDILHVTRRLQGFPLIVLDAQEPVAAHVMEQEQEPPRINLDSDALDDPLVRRAPAPDIAAPKSSFQAPSTTSRSASTAPTATSKGRAGSSLNPRPALTSALPPRSAAVSFRKTMPTTTTTTTTKSRPPITASMVRGPRAALSARPINRNVPVPKAGKVERIAKGKAVKEDEELRKALQDIGGEDMVLDLGY